MSAYRDAVAEAVPLGRGPRCTMCAFLAHLAETDPDSYRDIVADLANPLVAKSTMGYVIAGMGGPKQHVVNRHARGECAP